MTHLELDYNDLEDGKFGNMPITITNFSISNNHLINFPSQFSILTNLVYLNMNANRIVNLEGFEQLFNLVELLLDDNKITEISETIIGLTHLKYISLKRNQFRAIGTTFESQSIHVSFFTNTIVERIDLEGNVNLTKAMMMKFDGIEQFLERRRINRVKNITAGALVSDSVFGLD